MYLNAHAAKICVFFLSPCLFLLPCSQTYMLPLPLSVCFPRLAWMCTAVLSNTASLRVPRFGAEHCREYCTSKSKHHEVLARSIKKQRCLLCSSERSCSFPIKNGLNRLKVFQHFITAYMSSLLTMNYENQCSKLRFPKSPWLELVLA